MCYEAGPSVGNERKCYGKRATADDDLEKLENRTADNLGMSILYSWAGKV